MTESTSSPVDAPNLDPTWVAREQAMTQLRQGLEQRSVVVLQGPPGAGKSTLWRQGIPAWVSSHFLASDHVVGHDLGPGRAAYTVEVFVSLLAARLNSIPNSLAPSDLEARVVEVLNQERYLLIIDPAEILSETFLPTEGMPALTAEERAQWAAFVTAASRGATRFLFVTREPIAWLSGVKLALGNLTPREATAYAAQILASHPDPVVRRAPELQELLAKLRGHALAITITLKGLQRLHPGALLRNIEESERYPMDAPTLPTDVCHTLMPAPLEAALDQAYGRMTSKHQRRLVVLSILDDLVDENVLEKISSFAHCPDRFVGARRGEWTRTLEAGVAVGLLTKLQPGFFGANPLVRAFVQRRWASQAGTRFKAELEGALTVSVNVHAELAEYLLLEAAQGRPQTLRALVALHERSLGMALNRALTRKLYSQAMTLLGALTEAWKGSSRSLELCLWHNRIRSRLELPDQTEPTPAPGLESHWRTLLRSLARLEEGRGHPEAAEALYRALLQEVSRHEELEALRGRAELERSLGVLYRNMRRVDEAEVLFAAARERSAALSDPIGEGLALVRLGELAQAAGDLPLAVARFSSALSLFESVDDSVRVSAVLWQLALAEEQRGEVQAALERCLAGLRPWQSDLEGKGRTGLEIVRRLLPRLEPQALEAAWERIGGEEMSPALQSALNLPNSQSFEV